MSIQTSWDEQAEWYSDLLDSNPDSYQEKVIKPNLLRLMAVKPQEPLLEIACGNGFFSAALSEQEALVTGIDSSSKIINIARKKYPNINFHVNSADKLISIADQSISQIACVMAIQNIENVKGMLAECKRVLIRRGSLHLVMNHPAFRVPKQSSWEWDDKNKIQYRRIDGYLLENKVSIQMHPGDRPKETTTSFHRPLQYYAKLLKNADFVIINIEEWISHRRSQPGLRVEAENRARQEIPLFIYIQAKLL